MLFEENHDLINFANLNKKALIIGMVNKIEIWDPVYLSTVDKKSQKVCILIAVKSTSCCFIYD